MPDIPEDTRTDIRPAQLAAGLTAVAGLLSIFAGIGSLTAEDDPTAEQVAERRLPGVRNLRLATRAEESVLRKRFHPILTDKPDGAA